ncbi:recombinase family protein [Ruminiclostridium cellulolyticum]|uniref:Resolvase domain protein n=1 Tax=Ruminiclostridium cellulolyticum (strain ATCC 35319 / DSM 5812 / JCM 6584 / H10) TaxID=394503 RepID=B8I5Z6_RUMCH|nr:recombinase family protein [Ruminiclostridium cellulolyticum]ACL74813.1 Resolvase domain protein [Ruminiclostridium cellulolyticum H10]
MEYIPPLVIANNFEQYNDIRNSIGEVGLEVGGYIRISTKKDSQITSIENQKKYIMEWASVNGYKIVDFYIDMKTGAYSYLRQEMVRMKNDISSGKIKGIVSKEISRTSRDILDIIELKRSLANQGAFFISIKEGYDSRTDDDEFLLVIHAGLAQKERKVTGSRVKITQMIKAKEGKTNVPTPALGYKLSPDGQHIIINPATAEIYQLIVKKFLEGWGRLKICKYLNSQGIRTNRGNASWSTNSIYAILTNPVYLGITMYNITLTVRDDTGKAKRMVRPRDQWIVKENTHQPLITKEKFERIQQLIQDKKQKELKEWSCTKKYLLSGLVYCGSCGSKLYGGRFPKKTAKLKIESERTPKDYYYYYFDRKTSGVCRNSKANFHMDIVEQKVIEKVKEILLSYDQLDEIINKKHYLFDTRYIKEKKENERLRDRLQTVNSAIRREQSAYEADVITLDEYKTRLDELRRQKLSLDEKLEKINSTPAQSGSLEVANKLKETIRSLHNLEQDFQYEIIRKLINKIYIKDNYSLEFEFTFSD